MAYPRILVSSLIASGAAAHGGPVVSRRHAAALRRRGFDVLHVAPCGEPIASDPVKVLIYPTGASPRDPSASKRYDATAVAALRALIDRYRPHVVYDVHGPAWAVDAASSANVPVVSMMGDYNWFCMQSFLVDSRLRRCSGPGDGEKCFGCVNKWHRFPQRLVHDALRPAAKAGLVTLPIWTKLTQATDYLARMRPRISTFVVGDRKAYEFLVEHGVAASKIARITQGLPANALVARPRPQAAAAGGRNLRFGFVGRPDPDKGLRVLARAFDSLPRELPAELWIVHREWATYDHLKRLFASRRRFAADLESGRIRLHRPATQDEVFELMAQIDVGVVPSLAFESPCLALLEFVAQRTPIVRSESLGMEHVIQDGVNGVTFPYGDWQALARAIHDIVADPSLIERWRAALPRISDDDEYARQLEQVFEPFFPARATATTKREPIHA